MEAWYHPAVAAQQPGQIRRIGVLMAHAENDPEGQAFVAAFRETLQKLGWAEGRNIRIDTRWAAEVELMPGFAKELIALQPDLILANNTSTTAAVLNQTSTIPIVFAVVADPVGSGFVASLARPGGNVTGFTLTEPTMTSKWLELLKEIAPHVSPAVYPFRFFAELGGLLCYGNEQRDQFRLAATYVDRVLRGGKPSELPVQAPVRFELVINLKTAKALGLDVVASVAWPLATAVAKRTQRLHGVWD